MGYHNGLFSGVASARPFAKKLSDDTSAIVDKRHHGTMLQTLKPIGKYILTQGSLYTKGYTRTHHLEKRMECIYIHTSDQLEHI